MKILCTWYANVRCWDPRRSQGYHEICQVTAFGRNWYINFNHKQTGTSSIEALCSVSLGGAWRQRTMPG